MYIIIIQKQNKLLSMRVPNIFISHRWLYREDYYNLTEKLDALGWRYYDYSVPQHDPLDANKKQQILSALEEQVRQCNFFIVIARMGSNTYWVQKEVEFALKYGKYILGVKPWDYQGNIPTFIQDACNSNGKIVGFNAPSIIKIIEKELE